MSFQSTPVGFKPFDRGLPERCVHQVFMDQAQRSAKRLAVIDPECALTYADLACAVNSIATRVHALTQDRDFRVALLFDQSAMYVASLLGVLQAGGTYVPLDARRSADWNRQVLVETDCEILVCSERQLEFARSIDPTHLMVANAEQESSSVSISFERCPNAVACIYFTSGTTGRAKGVCDTQRNLLHNAMRYTNTLKVSQSDRLSLIQAPIFSGTQSTLFAGLLNGATIASFDVHRWGLEGLPVWIQENALTMFHSVPAIFRTLARSGRKYPSVRLIRLEGDRAGQQDVCVYQKYFSAECVLVNGLGATECGLVRQYFVNKDSNVAPGDLPLGYPVPDMEVIVLDPDGNELAAKQTGEIAVRSRFLAAGYLNQPELTQSKFLESSAGDRLYLTGDMGSLDEQGCLRLSGRKDHQLKINGQTVNLAEVEAALVDLPKVATAAAVTQEDDSGNGYLAAYLVCSEQQRPSLEQVREWLTQKLPTHLRPKRIMWLAEFPLSIDGKVDRSALPVPPVERPQLDTPYVAARDPEEQRMVTVWEDVLQISPVGIRDNFLLLGGESLTAMQLLLGLEAEFGVSVSVATLFENATIEALLPIIEAERRS
ncbi:MAG: non-ribosomal peptide synthetase [Pseudomonadales bacterium]